MTDITRMQAKISPRMQSFTKMGCNRIRLTAEEARQESKVMGLDGVRALVFDVFGTIVDWRNGIAREAAPFLKRHGSDGDPADFADAWRRRYDPAMEAVRCGLRPFVRLDVLHRQNLEDVLPEFGVNVSDVPDSELADLNLAWHRLDAWPDAVAGLARLKARYIIAPLSNGNVILMLDLAKRSGLPWDAILGAELVRAYKPSPEAYLRTADILAMHPSELCMVAAHNADLVAARSCGLKTAFITRPTEHGTHQTTDLSAERNWCIISSDLDHLADILGA